MKGVKFIMEIIALQQYTDKYVSLYEGEIRNLEDKLANKLIEKNIVKPHGTSTGNELPSVTSSNNGDVLTVVNGAWAASTASGGDDNIVFIETSVMENIDTGECTGGFYKDVDNDILYTYDEMVSLYKSGATLLAYYDEWPISYIEVGDNGDEDYTFSVVVESSYAGAYYRVWLTSEGYNNYCGSIDVRSFYARFRLNGSPSSLTGDDIYISNDSFNTVYAAANEGKNVIGECPSLNSAGSQYAKIEMISLDNHFVSILFRFISYEYSQSGDYMEVLEISLNNRDGDTHTHSEHHRYALTAYTP